MPKSELEILNNKEEREKLRKQIIDIHENTKRRVRKQANDILLKPHMSKSDADMFCKLGEQMELSHRIISILQKSAPSCT